MDRTELLTIAGKEEASRKPCRILCCTGTGCQSSGSLVVKKHLEDAVAKRGLGDRIDVVGVGCLAFCGQGPLLELTPDDLLFQRVAPGQADAIVGELAGEAPAAAARGDRTHPFYSRQMRIVREFSGRIDPDRIDDVISLGA